MAFEDAIYTRMSQSANNGFVGLPWLLEETLAKYVLSSVQFLSQVKQQFKWHSFAF